MKKIKLNVVEKIPCLNIKDLKKITKKDFFNNFTLNLKEETSKKLIDYYNVVRRERYGSGGTLPSEYTHEYNKICNDWQRKVITIGINDDLVIVFIKHVQMFKYIYNRMEGLPISISDNKNNELQVLLELFKFDMVYKVGGLEKEMKNLYKYGFELSEQLNTYNFYSYIPRNYEKMTNKWRTKKGINRMLNMKNLTWEVLKKYTEKIEIISGGFDNWKIKSEGEVMGKKLSKAIKNYKFWEDKNVIYYMFSYKDIPVGLCVYIIVNNITHQIVNKSIGHSIYDKEFNPLNEQETLELEEIKKRSNALIHYITIKDLNDRGIEHGYFGGSFSMKSLRTYKKIMNDKEIEHHIYKLKVSKLN